MRLKRIAMISGGLVLVAAAAMAGNAWLERSTGDARVGRPLLSELDLSKAARITIQANEGSVTLNASGGRNWTVAEQGGFPADEKKLSGLLIKLNTTAIAHKVTQSAERLPSLGLLTPGENNEKREKGTTGALLSIFDEAGTPLYQLVLGNDRQGGTSGFGGQYVRFPEDSTAYLIGQGLLRDYAPKDWISKVVFDVVAEETLASLRIVRAGASPVVLFREKAGEPWKLEGTPDDQVNQKEAKAIANQLAALDIYGIADTGADAAQLGRKRTGRAEVSFFDGRSFTIDVGDEKGKDDFRYLSISARLDAAKDDAALKAQVEAFNSRYNGRMLAVYDWDGSRLLSERKTFITPVGGKK